MRQWIFVFVILLLSRNLHGKGALQKIDGMLPTCGDEIVNVQDRTPPSDSICLVFAGVTYGGNFSSPQNYPNAKKVTNVIVGSYYFPVVIWETGSSWSWQSVFSYWDDGFKYWSYPDSFSSNDGMDTGRGVVCSDDMGNLHFAWHQTGNPDGYEIYYTRALLDTSQGYPQYSIEIPQMISETNGDEETFPNMAIHNDNPFAIWMRGDIGNEQAIMYNRSTDNGVTWVGADTAYADSMVGSWFLPSIAHDPSNGDMWVAICLDITGDGSMDAVALHWDAAGDTWDVDTAGVAPDMHPFACSAIAVDSSSIPHIIFQQNLSNYGGQGGLSGWNQCGPAGSLYYVHKLGGAWCTPIKLMFPDTMLGLAAGYPSIGITSHDTLYFTTSLPESVTPDTGVYLPFNAVYAALVPYTGEMLFGGDVSGLESGFTNAIYPSMAYRVTLWDEIPPSHEPGCDITWCQLEDCVPPTDVYYCHKDLIPPGGIAEEPVKSKQSLILTAYPNPFATSTTIHLAGIGHGAERTELQIFDLSGRLVKTISLVTCDLSLGARATWDGRDNAGQRVAPGVYFVKLGEGKKVLTRKLIMVK